MCEISHIYANAASKRIQRTSSPGSYNNLETYDKIIIFDMAKEDASKPYAVAAVAQSIAVVVVLILIIFIALRGKKKSPISAPSTTTTPSAS